MVKKQRFAACTALTHTKKLKNQLKKQNNNYQGSSCGLSILPFHFSAGFQPLGLAIYLVEVVVRSPKKESTTLLTRLFYRMNFRVVVVVLGEILR